MHLLPGNVVLGNVFAETSYGKRPFRQSDFSGKSIREMSFRWTSYRESDFPVNAATYILQWLYVHNIQVIKSYLLWFAYWCNGCPWWARNDLLEADGFCHFRRTTNRESSTCETPKPPRSSQSWYTEDHSHTPTDIRTKSLTMSEIDLRVRSCLHIFSISAVRTNLSPSDNISH